MNRPDQVGAGGYSPKMPPRKSITLTEAELRLMRMLWQRGESAVSELVAAMPEGEALAYTSVLTTVRILEQKGYVQHRQEGRAFLYSPCVQEQEASRSEVRHMMQRFFGNSRERLLLSLLGDDEIDAEELGRLKQAIVKAAAVETVKAWGGGEPAYEDWSATNAANGFGKKTRRVLAKPEGEQ